MTTFREIMLQEAETQRQRDVRLLLEQPWLQYTNDGFKIDVLKLVDELSEKKKDELIAYIHIKRLKQQNKTARAAVNFVI